MTSAVEQAERDKANWTAIQATLPAVKAVSRKRKRKLKVVKVMRGTNRSN